MLLINTEVDRLLSNERKELLKNLEISERTFCYWMKEPEKIKSIYKEAIRKFLNKKLDKNYSIKELFSLSKKAV